MGCASSKPKPLCRNCQTPCSPMTRSYSIHVLHPPQRQGDSYHMVALTSSTLGSLQLDPNDQNHRKDEERAPIPNQVVTKNSVESESKQVFDKRVIEARNWSEMIDQKIPKAIPKTPIRTPPSEPETINAWELMEGLEDSSPIKPPNHLRCFSFPVASDSVANSFLHHHHSNPKIQDCEVSPKPMWMEMADSDSNSNSKATSIVSEFDPEVISAFRETLEELPPANPFNLKPPMVCEDQELEEETDCKKPNGIVNGCNNKDRMIVYFTSLRGVRKTYEDCCYVRVILKGLGLKLDERDVSMHSGYKDELKELLGDGFHGGGLPRVFIGKRYIGGVDEIRRMNEEGQLEKLLVDCGSGGVGGGVCEACGDIRFVPCETCSGSCKIYYEEDYNDDDDEEAFDEEQCGFQRCPDCNENGLIRCPICCD